MKARMSPRVRTITVDVADKHRPVPVRLDHEHESGFIRPPENWQAGVDQPLATERLTNLRAMIVARAATTVAVFAPGADRLVADLRRCAADRQDAATKCAPGAATCGHCCPSVSASMVISFRVRAWQAPQIRLA